MIDGFYGSNGDPGRLPEILGPRASPFGDVRIETETCVVEGDPSSQAISVGMKPRASQADDLVAFANVLARECMLLLDDSHAEAGEVVFAGLIELGEDRGFASHECTFGI